MAEDRDLICYPIDFENTFDQTLQFATDPRFLRSFTLPCRVPWRDGVLRLVAKCHSEIAFVGG